MADFVWAKSSNDDYCYFRIELKNKAGNDHP